MVPIMATKTPINPNVIKFAGPVGGRIGFEIVVLGDASAIAIVGLGLLVTMGKLSAVAVGVGVVVSSGF